MTINGGGSDGVVLVGADCYCCRLDIQDELMRGIK